MWGLSAAGMSLSDSERQQAVKRTHEVAGPAQVQETLQDSGAKKLKQDLTNLPTRQYLDQTVVPILLQVARLYPSHWWTSCCRAWPVWQGRDPGTRSSTWRGTWWGTRGSTRRTGRSSRQDTQLILPSFSLSWLSYLSFYFHSWFDFRLLQTDPWCTPRMNFNVFK